MESVDQSFILLVAMTKLILLAIVAVAFVSAGHYRKPHQQNYRPHATTHYKQRPHAPTHYGPRPQYFGKNTLRHNRENTNMV